MMIVIIILIIILKFNISNQYNENNKNNENNNFYYDDYDDYSMPVLSNWMPLQSSPTKNWQGIATSESGQYIAAVAYNGGACQIDGGGIFVNTNWVRIIIIINYNYY